MGFFSGNFFGGLGEALLGDALGGAIKGGINSAFSAKQAELEAKLQRENWEYAQKNAHQFEVGDLRAAGLNPILSATNGQVVGLPSAPSGHADTSNTVNSAVAAKRQYEVAKTQADTDKLNAETKKAEADTNRINAENNERLINAMIPFNEAQTAKVNEEVKKISQDIMNSVRLTTAQIKQLESGTALNYSQISKIEQDIKESVSRSGLNDAQKSLILADLDGFKRKLGNLTAKQQLEALDTGFGEVSNKFGFYASRWLQAVSGAGISSTGNAGVRF